MKTAKIGIVRPTAKMTIHLVNILKNAGLFKPYEKDVYSGVTWK